MSYPKPTYDNLLDCRIELHRSTDGEWAGLYIDGKLDTYGDAYHSEERLFELVGGIYVDDSPWLIDNRTPRDTTEEIEAAREERDARIARAAELRAQAAELEAEAAELSA